MSLIQRKLSQTHFGITYSHMIRSKNRFPRLGPQSVEGRCPFPLRGDRLPLAGSANTNENRDLSTPDGGLIQAGAAESSRAGPGQRPYAVTWPCARHPSELPEGTSDLPRLYRFPIAGINRSASAGR